jgi:hypothetical protein
MFEETIRLKIHLRDTSEKLLRERIDLEEVYEQIVIDYSKQQRRTKDLSE